MCLIFFFIDQIEKLYQPVADTKKCSTQCDPNAVCSCGTLSGTNQCACLPGYAGTGIYGKCHSKC